MNFRQDNNAIPNLNRLHCATIASILASDSIALTYIMSIPVDMNSTAKKKMLVPGHFASDRVFRFPSYLLSDLITY